MKKFLISLIALFFLSVSPSWAAQRLEFGLENSTITGSIKYALVGRYNANFEKYKGFVVYDEDKKIIKAVRLEIDADTIYSKHPNLDKIVRSKQILHVKKYPKIIFEGRTVEEIEEGYLVKGMLKLHGLKRKLNFPFNMKEIESEDGQKYLNVNGKWVIKRKIFGIIWNKILDRGGIVVGNHITINWDIDFDL